MNCSMRCTTCDTVMTELLDGKCRGCFGDDKFWDETFAPANYSGFRLVGYRQLSCSTCDEPCEELFDTMCEWCYGEATRWDQFNEDDE